ncbi:hypothetical protein PTKIN_Ptkin10aG0018000 [Pterospermum kingtungense]
METKNKKEKLEVLRCKLGFESNAYVDPEGLSGGLALWWRDLDNMWSLRMKVMGNTAGFFESMDLLILMIDSMEKFTWINKREEGLVKERIDRAMVNLGWLEVYLRSQEFNLPILGSDHRLVLVDSDFRDKKSARQFKFEILWTKNEECGQIEEIQKNGMNEVEFKEVVSLTIELERVWQREEKWFQRSRVKWLKYRDQNTSFFHQATEKRIRKNKVLSLKALDRSWADDEDALRCMFFNYYKQLFSTEGDRVWDGVLDAVPVLVSDDMNELLCKEVSEDEIYRAVFDIGALRAPGPDGFNKVFYHKY